MAVDLIAKVVGPDWSYPLARLLVVNNEVTVWVPSSPDEPVQTFQIGANALRARGASLDGSVTWTRRGSGCGWPFARCNLSEAKLRARYDKWKQSESHVEVESEPAPQPEPELEPEDLGTETPGGE